MNSDVPVCFVFVAGRMCLCIAADGDVLGDGSDSFVHDRHDPRSLPPHVWHHEVLGCESPVC